MARAVFQWPVGGLYVEVDASNCIVIRQPRLRDDVRITVGDVAGLVHALEGAKIAQRIADGDEHDGT